MGGHCRRGGRPADAAAAVSLPVDAWGRAALRHKHRYHRRGGWPYRDFRDRQLPVGAAAGSFRLYCIGRAGHHNEPPAGIRRNP